MRYTLVVAHILPFKISDEQISSGQHLEAMALHDFLVLVVPPGDLGVRAGMHLAGQHNGRAHQIQMGFLGVDDARLLRALVLLLGHYQASQLLVSVRGMHHGAGIDGLGASASDARVDSRLAQHMIDNVHGAHTNDRRGRVLCDRVRFQIINLRRERRVELGDSRDG